MQAAPYTGLLPPSMGKDSFLPTALLGAQPQQDGDLQFQGQIQP